MQGVLIKTKNTSFNIWLHKTVTRYITGSDLGGDAELQVHYMVSIQMKEVITAGKMYFIGGKTNDPLHSSKRIYTLMLQHYKLRRDKIKEGIYFNFPVSASSPTTELLNVIEEQPDSWRHSSTGLGADGVAGRRRTTEPDPENTHREGGSAHL